MNFLVVKVKTPVLIGVLSALAIVCLLYLSLSGSGFVALWATPDQLGRLAFERNDFAVAAELFEDSQWLGAARFESGQYEEAAQAYALDADAIGFYNRGVALVKGREYAQAIASFELALAEEPQWPQAQANLELARYILDYIETSREQSGTEGKLEADEYRYDASAERGERAIIRDTSRINHLSAEKWMRSVDTQTSEFLSQRFALEAAQGDSQ